MTRITALVANKSPYGMLVASLLDVPTVVSLYGVSEFACRHLSSSVGDLLLCLDSVLACSLSF